MKNFALQCSTFAHITMPALPSPCPNMPLPKCHEVNITITNLFGLQWQWAPSKDVSKEYWVWFSGRTTLDQCICRYAWAELIVHHYRWENGAKVKKKKQSLSLNYAAHYSFILIYNSYFDSIHMKEGHTIFLQRK